MKNTFWEPFYIPRSLSTGTCISRPWRRAGWPTRFFGPTHRLAFNPANAGRTRERLGGGGMKVNVCTNTMERKPVCVYVQTYGTYGGKKTSILGTDVWRDQFVCTDVGKEDQNVYGRLKRRPVCMFRREERRPICGQYVQAYRENQVVYGRIQRRHVCACELLRKRPISTSEYHGEMPSLCVRT